MASWFTATDRSGDHCETWVFEPASGRHLKGITMHTSGVNCHRRSVQICLGHMHGKQRVRSFLIVAFCGFIPSLHCATTSANDKALRYDFGISTESAATDYVRIGSDDVYTKERGYGLVPSSTKKERGARRRHLAKDKRLDSFVFDDGGLAFRQRLPNGRYFVSLATGDVAYASETAVTINGVSIHLMTRTQRGEVVRVDGGPRYEPYPVRYGSEVF